LFDFRNGDRLPGGKMNDLLPEQSSTESSSRRVFRRLDTRGREIDWRRNLYAIWIAELLAIVGFSLRTPFLPFYLQDLGATSDDSAALWAGLINAGGAGVMALTAPLWGALADRRGRRPMLMRAMFCATCTVGLMGLATAPWQLLGLRFVEGAFTGTVTAATALVAASAPKDRLGYSLGMIQMAVFSGSSLGPLFGGILSDQIGYRATFIVAASMLFTGGLIVTFVVRERFTPIVRTQTGERGLKAMRASSAWMFSGVMGAMILMLFASRFASSAVQPIIPIFVEQMKNGGKLWGLSSATTSGLALGALGLTSALSSIFLGRLGDKRGHRRILLACAVGGGVLYLPMALATSSWQLVVLQGLFGIAAGGLVPTANAIVAHRTPAEQRGVIYGVTAAAASIGGFFGPLIGAGVAAAVGFGAAFVITGLCLLSATWLVWRSFRRNDTVAAVKTVRRAAS
jgi:DHA1 family multidrug resistance protein-like MFS transporter